VEAVSVPGEARKPDRAPAPVRRPAGAQGEARSRVRPETRCFDSQGFVRFLRAAFPQSPAQHLAHLIGCPASTAEKWLRREGAPSAQYLAAMISLFGPAFVAATVQPSPDWAARAARDQKRAELIRALDDLND
jgi:hypothetical protein